MEENLKKEKTFYQDGNVTVTQSRYIADSKTYAMRNISSVSLFEIEQSKTLPILLISVGLLILVFANDIKIFGAIMAGLGVLWFISIKNLFSVRISTNSGETNSLISKDKVYVEKVVSALNDAIIHRG